MQLFKRKIILIAGLLVLMMEFMFLNSFSQYTVIDNESMTGVRFIHQFKDKDDSLSSPEIIELRDEHGMPVWFGRDFRKGRK